MTDSGCKVEQLRPKWQTAAMSIEQWWPKLNPSTREWLVENNGDAVPAEMVVEITNAGGSVPTDAREGSHRSEAVHPRRRL
jgi:hypothetical protein